MKRAVEILQQTLPQEGESVGGGSDSPCVLLATVKGDVHDIGKNIVSVVLGCNGYEVIDLGVMVPAEEIVNKAVEKQVDIIGLSGLITPSLEEMVNVARALQERHLHIPLMIGGATTSELHTALKIAPVYQAPVVWMKDASQNAQAISRLLNKEQQQVYAEELQQRYAQLSQDHEKADSEPLPLEEARRRKPDFFS
jgi:5-methyltetrahydrofolate--homocysteine methyltransferase